jgi:DNA-binding transcriptional LysR family regulator
MIDRYLLRYFLAVVDNGTFSRAAEQANVSQPTLSVGIAKLERLIGAPLFHRSSQRVHLTEAGTRLLPHARTIENGFQIAQQAVRGARSAPVLRVGVLNSVPMATIAGAVADARTGDPAARIELIEGSERQLTQHLARGRIDIALTLVGRGGDRFLEEALYDESYALALSASHPLAGAQLITAEALGDNVMIVRRHCEALPETSRHFTDRGVRPFFALRTTNDDSALKMVAAGLGVTVMPEGFTSPGVVRPRMAGFDIRRTIGIAYAAQTEALRITRPAFISALHDILRRPRSGQTIPLAKLPPIDKIGVNPKN